MRPVTEYATLVFDCDGVLLNSNHIKTKAFQAIACAEFNQEAAADLVGFHLENGGLSRQAKFEYLLSNWRQAAKAKPSLEELVNQFAATVSLELRNAELIDGLDALRARCAKAKWIIVSGGDADEIRAVLDFKKVARFFDGGIFGNPLSKVEILERELASGNIRGPALYLGDSRLDHISAAHVGLDFCFVSDWTDFVNWRQYCEAEGLTAIGSLRELLYFSS